MSRANLLPSLIAIVIGIAGVLLILFAWHLPPFAGTDPVTENAYVRGKVTSIAPQIAGYVAEVDAVDFQPVTRGQIIARIDDRIPRQKLAQAEAQLAATQAALSVGRQSVASAQAGLRANEAGLDAARSGQETAQTASDRSVSLQTRGIASQSSADQTELALRQAQAGVIQAQAQLDVQREAVAQAQIALNARQAEIEGAEAAVQLARIELANTIIRAPADGTLGQVSVHVGQYVTPGSALVSHVGRDVWVIANFRETALAGLKAGEVAHFSVDALQGQTFTGRVQSFSPATASEYSVLSGSNATGNFTKIAQRLPVRIAIDADQPRADLLRPGMSVVVRIDTTTQGTGTTGTADGDDVRP